MDRRAWERPLAHRAAARAAFTAGRHYECRAKLALAWRATPGWHPRRGQPFAAYLTAHVARFASERS